MRRVAALADVHGNAPALAAVLTEVEVAAPDLIVFCGDLTWGSLPRETLELVRSLRTPARFVRGNGDRAVGTLLEGRGEWMAGGALSRGPRVRRRFRGDRLGRRRWARADVLLPRFAEVRHRVRDGGDAGRTRARVHGRDRRACRCHCARPRAVRPDRRRSPAAEPRERRSSLRGTARRVLGAARPGRRASPHLDDVEAAVAQMRATNDPSVEAIVELMLESPPRDAAVTYAEEVVFSE